MNEDEVAVLAQKQLPAAKVPAMHKVKRTAKRQMSLPRMTRLMNSVCLYKMAAFPVHRQCKFFAA